MTGYKKDQIDTGGSMTGRAFAGKVVLITGAGSGIGRATALAFAEAGAAVVVADIAAGAGAETVARIEAADGRARFEPVDVTQPESVQGMVERTVAAYGRLDCAFNNAGIEIENAPTADCPEDVFDRTMDINVKGVWLCMKYQIRQMLAQGGGAIVNTASVAGLKAAPTFPAYAASKHAVVGLTKTAAVEYARAGIRINAVCPGVINTPMMASALALDPKRKKITEAMHPIGRVGEPGEVAQAVLWLCSDAASFIVGEMLQVDGGFVAR
jgi:NAD(P)-dependent dehydrogenase (short-subunit alcohol dehydrogenase family)